MNASNTKSYEMPEEIPTSSRFMLLYLIQAHILLTEVKLLSTFPVID